MQAYTVKTFCAWADIGVSKFYAEIGSGRLKARKLGGKTIVLVEDAEKWRKALPVLVPKPKVAA